MRKNYDPAVRKFLPPKTPRHITRREGDEMACKCGARWDAGEQHP